jgi:hypothetical protein
MSDEKKNEAKTEGESDIRMVDILRIRKSNTKNSLWESAEGKAFIAKAKAGVKKAKVTENKAFLYVWEVLDE